MKVSRFLIIRLVGLLLLAAASQLPASEADPQKSFLGWIPIQNIPAGTERTLDMNRFFRPAAGDRLVVPEGKNVALTFDHETLALKITVDKNASGLVDLPLEVRDSNGKPVMQGILTLSVQAHSNDPASGKPGLFAGSRSPDHVIFEVDPSKDSHIKTISAIAQFPDGSSKKAFAEFSENQVRVSLDGLPEGAWVRVAASDESGSVSQAARVRVGETKEFQWQDGIIYYAFTDRFVNGNRENDRPVLDERVLPQANYFGGDFDGIRQRVEDGYFEKLGVNVLWLAPLNRNPDGAWQEYLPPYRSYTGYHGYWPVSHSEVEPRFGGEQGLKNLISSAHDKDLKIIADLVLKHSHIDHPLWKEKKEWFGNLILPDGTKNLRIWDAQQFTTWFEEWLPGFDFSKAEPVNFLIANAGEWASKYQLDGYRLDAVKHIQYSFWPQFRSSMRGLHERGKTRSMYFVGETFMDREGIMSFVGPNMLDGQFDFPLYDTIIDVFAKGKQGFAELEKSLAASETIYGKETLMSPLLGNHDKSRFMAYADGDLPVGENDDEEEIGWANPPKVDNASAYEKLKLALTFLLTIDGVPMIYYGDEVGLTGAGDPDNRRMMPADGALDSAQKSVREHFSTIAALRSNHPALRYGNRRVLIADDTRYAFSRRHFDDSVLIAWNRGPATATYKFQVAPEVPDGTYSNHLGNQTIQVKNGETEFDLPPMTSAVFSR